MCNADVGKTSYGSSCILFVMFVTFQAKLKKSDNFSKKNCVISNFINICSTVLQLHAYTRTNGRTDSEVLIGTTRECEKRPKNTTVTHLYS